MGELFVQEGSFIQLPVQWVLDMKGDDLKRMSLLQWRFDFFASVAAEEGRDIRRCFYESQEKLACLFGMSFNSRTKVGIFLKRMEKEGYVSTQRESLKCEDGTVKTRVYIVVNNPILLSKYNLAP